MSVLETTQSIVATAREKRVRFKAASIAYYALASVVPLLVLALATLSVLGTSDVLISFVRPHLSPTGDDVLTGFLMKTDRHRVAGVLGLAFTVWSGSKVVRGFTIAFEELYDVGAGQSLLERILKSALLLVMLLGTIALLTAMAVLLELGSLAVWNSTVIGNLVGTCVLALVLFPFYYVLPPIETTVRHALPGTIVSATGLVVLQLGLFYYVKLTGSYSAYGVLGSVLLFITVLYLAATVLLIGVVLNVAADW